MEIQYYKCSDNQVKATFCHLHKIYRNSYDHNKYHCLNGGWSEVLLFDQGPDWSDVIGVDWPNMAEMRN